MCFPITLLPSTMHQRTANMVTRIMIPTCHSEYVPEHRCCFTNIALDGTARGMQINIALLSSPNVLSNHRPMNQISHRENNNGAPSCHTGCGQEYIRVSSLKFRVHCSAGPVMKSSCSMHQRQNDRSVACPLRQNLGPEGLNVSLLRLQSILAQGGVDIEALSQGIFTFVASGSIVRMPLIVTDIASTLPM
jgi:hypothetical protein